MNHLIPPLQCPSVNRNAIHSIIKKFRDAFPNNFDKCGLEICPKCEGTGLPIKPNKNGNDITFWDLDTYCENCKGYGVTNIDRIYDEYLCKKCKGSGCDNCNQKGSIDWIAHAVKK